jgi:formylglycine-generating enzyme required for sulfatase activity
MFYAQLIDAKDSKLSSKGSYIRTGVGTGDITRVSSALAQQLKGSGRRRSAPAPTRSYPAELDIEMVFVEGGTFTMGCNGTTDAPCYSNDNREKPVRSVTLSNFYIGKYEITQAQWRAVMKGHSTLSNPGSWKDDDQLPIEGVSWLDIDTAFLPRLNALTGRTTTATKYRLATGAEWEYAARGCKAGVCDNYKYSGSDVLGDVAWYTSNAGSRTHPVGQKKPNSLGIYDMSGSVFEWVWDWWDSNYYTNTLKDGDVNPTGPVTGSQPSRGTRSNSWFHDPSFSRNSFRTAFDPSDRRNTIGFRVVLPAQ